LADASSNEPGPGPFPGGLDGPRSDRRRFLACAALLFLVTAARLPRTFLHSSFWAEDGTYFFREAIEDGGATLWRPVIGAYQTLPRIVAWLATFLPVQWAPALFALGAGLLASASLAVFSRAGFRWLVPDDRVRLFLCLLFSLAPGMGESFFALCTVNYVLFAGVLMLLLERDAAGRWSMGLRRALLVAFLWLSVAQGSVLVLPLLCLFFATRNRNYLVCLATLAASIALNLAAPNEARPAVPPPPLDALADVYLHNSFMRLVYLPLLGLHGLAPVTEMSQTAFLLLSTALLVLCLGLMGRAGRVDAAGATVLGAIVASALALFPVTALVRFYGLAMLWRPSLAFSTRYDVAPSILVLILAWTWLHPPGRAGGRRLARYALLAWLTTNVMVEPLFRAPEPFLPFAWEWPGQAAAIEAALAAKRAGRLREPVTIRDIRCQPPSYTPRAHVRISP